eukprot:TRINITY_DN33190_c0_g1_i1.p2 TRINITY_DN33190_c0_g1~~TRINITY_DN33190_c0_g1_i1.p2  ORF type:complete len:232 (+),score=75.55 TRINITY_DN33190_c0_g1_i1:29-697(+)
MPRVISVEALHEVNSADEVVFSCEGDDGEVVAAQRSALLGLCQTLRSMMEDQEEGCEAMAMPLPAPRGVVMDLCTYCEYRAKHTDEHPYTRKDRDEPVMRRPVLKKLEFLFENEFDRDFMIGPEGVVPNADVRQHARLLDLMHLCNFLHIEWLKDLCVCAVASFVTGRTVDSLREDVFGLPPATEEDIRHYREAHDWIDKSYNISTIAKKEEKRASEKKSSR